MVVNIKEEFKTPPKGSETITAILKISNVFGVPQKFLLANVIPSLFSEIFVIKSI